MNINIDDADLQKLLDESNAWRNLTREYMKTLQQLEGAVTTLATAIRNHEGLSRC